MKYILQLVLLLVPSICLAEPVEVLKPHEFKINVVDLGHTKTKDEESNHRQCLRVYLDIIPPIEVGEELTVDFELPKGLDSFCYLLHNGHQIDTDGLFIMNGYNHTIDPYKSTMYTPHKFIDILTVSYDYYFDQGNFDSLEKLKLTRTYDGYIVPVRSVPINGMEMVLALDYDLEYPNRSLSPDVHDVFIERTKENIKLLSDCSRNIGDYIPQVKQMKFTTRYQKRVLTNPSSRRFRH